MPVIMLMLITLLNDGESLFVCLSVCQCIYMCMLLLSFPSLVNIFRVKSNLFLETTGTLIAIGYDNVVPQSTPTVWNLRALFTVGIVLAGVACASSLLLLSLSLNSWQEGSVYQRIGLGGISYGQITTSIYLKVSVSDFLTLFSARAGEDWFWTSRPAPILLGAGALALATSTALACVWPLSRPDGIPTLGLLRRGNNHILPLYIWIYCILWWFIQVRSCAKV